ncbi:MAG: hypothetical protein JNK24_01505 [Alphaproteobacteria bacterium]|nr:hypothetical protein [Alphaproteobacteria bacterium]
MPDMLRSKSSDFNIMDAAGYGHFRVWKDRAYLMKLALVPFLIKLASIVAVMAMEYQEDYLKQGLVMLPSLCAMGWMLAQYTRTLLLNERWPTTMTHMTFMMRQGSIDKKKAMGFIMWRARGILASILVYVFFGLVSSVLVYLMSTMLVVPVVGDGQQAEISQAAADASLSPLLSLLTLVAGVGLMIGAFWSFRLVWLYIPFAVLYPLRDYLYQVRGFMSSLRYIVLFFCCMAPASFVMMMVVRLIFTILGGGDTATIDGNDVTPMNIQIARFLTIGLQSFTEILIALIWTAGFAWAMRGFLPRAKDTFNDFPSMSIKK